MRASDARHAQANATTATIIGALALVALGGAFVLGLYGLTPEADRPGLLEDLRPLLVAAVAGLPGVIAAVLVRSNHQETREQTGRLATIERQTNGELKATVAAVVAAALDDRFPVQRVPVQYDVPLIPPATPVTTPTPEQEPTA